MFLRLDVEICLSLLELDQNRLEALAKDLWIEVDTTQDLKDILRSRLNSDPLSPELEAFISQVVWGA